MAWAKNGTPDTLTGTASVLTITDCLSLKFNQFMYHTIPVGLSYPREIIFHGLTTSIYSDRNSTNGGADGARTSQASILADSGSSGLDDQFFVWYLIGIATEEKLCMGFGTSFNTAGAGTAPQRKETVGKQADTTNAVDSITVTENGAGTYAADSNLSALGTD